MNIQLKWMTKMKTIQNVFRNEPHLYIMLIKHEPCLIPTPQSLSNDTSHAWFDKEPKQPQSLWKFLLLPYDAPLPFVLVDFSYYIKPTPSLNDSNTHRDHLLSTTRIQFHRSVENSIHMYIVIKLSCLFDCSASIHVTLESGSEQYNGIDAFTLAYDGCLSLLPTNPLNIFVT